MASFCEKCGFPQSASSAFCSQCGARNGAAPPPAGAPYPASGPLSPPAKGGSGLKILMIVLACLGVLVVLIGAGVYYAVHKVKEVVVEKAKENGVDLSGLSGSSSGGSHTPKFKNPCDLLSKEDASRLLGEPIERSVARDQLCLYMGPKGLAAKLAQENATDTFQKAKTPGADVDPMDVTNALDGILSTAAGEVGQNGLDGEWPLLMLGAEMDGKPIMVAMETAKGFFNGMMKGDNPKHKGFGTEVQGVGDKAVRLPKLGLAVLKGDALLHVIIGPVPDADARSIAVAKEVLPRI
jgi:hypothetical protein